MKKIIIAILSTMLMTQSIVPVIAEGTLITEFSEESDILEVREDNNQESQFIIEDTAESISEDTGDTLEEVVTENSSELREGQNKTENSFNPVDDELMKYKSSRELMSSKFLPSFIQNVEYGKKQPMSPYLTKVPFKINTYFELKQYLTNNGSYSIELGADIDILEKVIIPPGAMKELDLGGHTIRAGTTGQIEVQGDYFKLMNGKVIGALGDNTTNVPSEDTKSFKGLGFIYAPMKTERKGPDLENDIVIENITHRSTTIGDGGMGGFMTVNASNVFFKGNNTLTNGNYNVKGGSVTFIDGKFVGTVTRQTDETTVHHLNSFGKDLTINIGFHGYGTSIERAESNQFIGDKRISVLEDAEVELYNLNKIGDKWYTNNIGNFAVITVEGSLKMYSSYPSLRSIMGERNSKSDKNYYKNSDAHTFNGMANINVLEGATFVAKATQPNGTHGAIFTYNTVLNVYRPVELDIDDMTLSSKDKYPFFHSGRKSGIDSQLNLYDMDVMVWPVNQTTTNQNVTIWEDVVALEHVGFSSFLIGNRAGTNNRAEPNINGLGNFNIRNYGRIRSEGDAPVIVPDSSFNKVNGYEFNNGDNIFFGKAYYRKKDEWGRVIPVRNGEVQLRSVNSPQTIFKTTTDNDGNWQFDFSNLGRLDRVRVGENELTVVEPIEYKSSKIVRVNVKDTIDPIGETQLIMFKKGDYTKLVRPVEDGAIRKAEDETTPSSSLSITYYNIANNRDRIINTPGSHEVTVEIKDAAGNYIRIPTPVYVYEGEKPNGAFIEGTSFTIDKNIFEDAMNSPDKSIMRDLLKKDEYGKVRAIELDSKGNQTDITDDVNKFKIEIGDIEVIGSGDNRKSRYPIKLTIIIDGIKKAETTIYATVVEDSIKVIVHQVESKNSWEGTSNTLPITKNIYSDLLARTPLRETEFYIEKSGGNNNIKNNLDEWERLNRLKLERDGYTRKQSSDGKYRFYTELFNDGIYYHGTGSTFPDKNTHIYLEYNKQTIFSEVPDFDYGKIKLTSKLETTHKLDVPQAGSGSLVGSNVATIVNTKEKSTWSLNLSIEDNKILRKENGQLTNEEFLGNLVYYNNGQEINISGTSATLYTYQKGSGPVDLIHDIEFYSANEREGMRLKEHIGNAVGDYQGNLIWTLTDSPIP